MSYVFVKALRFECSSRVLRVCIYSKYILQNIINTIQLNLGFDLVITCFKNFVVKRSLRRIDL